jgi:hypothetical protein
MSNDQHMSDNEFDAKVRKMLGDSGAPTPDPTLALIQARRQAERADDAYLDRLADLVAARLRRRPTIEPYDAGRATEKADEQWRAAINNELNEVREMVGTLADLLGKALDRVTALEKSVAMPSSESARRK